jgi:type I restriction enzyme R subunit
MNEADTCRNYIVPNLKIAGWEDDAILEQYVLTPGRIVPVGNQHTRKQGLRPDYVLFIRRNIPIAVVEAKADYVNAADGLAQAIRYAEMLGVKFAYASNGRKIIEHDFITGLERDLENFPTPDELWSRLEGTLNLPQPQDKTDALSAYWEQVGGKTPRYYQMPSTAQ